MKIVLLMLSGEEGRAREELQQQYPTAQVETLSREEFEKVSARRRLQQLRSMKPDVFAVMTERLVWQRGQDALLSLGAMAGGRSSVILDAHGGWRKESRGSLMAKSATRLAREALASRAALRRNETELKRLESAIEKREHELSKSRASDGPASFTYLRSSPGPGTQAGGAASHINGFITAALRLGARVAFLSNDEIAGLDPEKLEFKVIWPEPVGSSRAAFDIYNNLRFTEAAMAEISRRQPDFIYQRYARLSRAGVASALHTKRPLFLEYNGSEVWVGQHWDRVDKLDLLARFERLNLRAATRIFVVSEVERRQLLKDGIEDARIVVNPNGVDTDRFKPGIGGENVRDEIGVRVDETSIGFVGTFGPWHGVEVLAEAIKILPRKLDLKFLFVGGGALLPRVEENLRSAGLADRAIFTGVVSHERVPSLLDACDILVSPHVPLAGGREFFGSPTKLFEYMAMGKAIVASRLGQIGDVLTDNATALLVRPGDVSELAGAIVRLAGSPELRGRLGSAARAEAAARHTWTHNAKRVLDAYQSWVDDDR